MAKSHRRRWSPESKVEILGRFRASGLSREAMARYFEVAEAELSNNACENSIRPAALGRKNYLFLGSAKAGGERASVFYSLTQSAKRLGLDPFEYLRDVIDRIASTLPERIDELTPQGWKEARQRAEKSELARTR